ncbi:aldo/keto reductase [Sorangium sp. So ce590]
MGSSSRPSAASSATRATSRSAASTARRSTSARPATRACGASASTSSSSTSPLGRGFFTGQIKRFEDLAPDDYRRFAPRFQGENFQKNLDLVAKVEDIAREKGVKASQLALAWVLAQGDFIVPIPGTKRRSYLEENVVAEAIALTEGDLRRLDAVAPKGAAAGPRYPEVGMRLVNQ